MENTVIVEIKITFQDDFSFQEIVDYSTELLENARHNTVEKIEIIKIDLKK